MELFSEIYGSYYQAVAKILSQTPLSRTAIQKEIVNHGFAESILELLPPLLDGSWPLLQQRDGVFFSRLKHPPHQPVSTLELRWLKAILQDPRAALFLSKKELQRLTAQLERVQPLYQQSWFRFFDRAKDGDPYQSERYRVHFRRVLTALKTQAPLWIRFRLGDHGAQPREQCGDFLPLRLEYSEKDDKFRVHCQRIQEGRLVRIATINLGRICETAPSTARYTGALDLEKSLAGRRCAEPVTVEVFPERSAIQRFLVAFSTYEKQSEFDPQTGVCRVRVWYMMADETELLIKMLSFGPTVRVLSPERFLRQVRQRVGWQSELLKAKEG